MLHSIDMAKAYDPASFEDRIYSLWMEHGCFKPIKADDPRAAGKKPYVIVIPPPNVTGVLHLGHGLNIALQDIVIRYHRMRGEPTLWLPGTDHAGIATQNVMEKRLREKGLRRQDLGREKFVEETWKLKEEHHAIIAKQIARTGCSVDWSRERFTMDEGLSRAVREVFVTLYERNLLYKGQYLVNWCPRCGTALSDDEVEHEDTPGKMYYIHYHVVGGGTDGVPEWLEFGTTRPETMLGDTAIAVHPEDPRYTNLVGKMVELPLTGRQIPVIADAYVDREFGTGVVKITPAHDPNDWEVGKRHNLEVINILTPDGHLNDNVPEKYRGMTVQDARKAVLADLEAGGFFLRDEKITHSVGHCYRCHTVIEPFLSEQWFVRMKPLAEKALAAWRKGDIVFYPKRWENTYEHWLENIRDWCVSRQLWWGHRIPAWYCADCGETSVSRTDLTECPKCHSKNIKQDEDVLDTWFSSWLWPFSTLGWEGNPCTTEDFKRFYPTTALITAYDIIFFWVSRMIMAGLEFTGKAPFHDIFITSLVRDKKGRKMSKSLGNGIDPLELVDEFGSDAMKFTLAFMCAQGQDILIDKESFKMGSKFANKVWNASRYILMNLEGRNLVASPALKAEDRWIYSRLNATAQKLEAAFAGYRYNEAASLVYEYFWNDFCDWYVEASKLAMKSGDDAEKDRATTVLLDVLQEGLRLLHPFLPMVTEEIWGKLPETCKRGDELLIMAAYPEYKAERHDAFAEKQFGFLQELVTKVRTLRSECGISPEKRIHVAVRTHEEGPKAFLEANAELVKMLAGLGELDVTPPVSGQDDPARGQDNPAPTAQSPAGAIALAGSGFDAFVFVAEAVDVAALKAKFSKELEKDRKFIQTLEAKLANGNFLKNAPAELVEGEKAKLAEAQSRAARTESHLKGLTAVGGAA
jgi:valyl-tRNA synthetase